MNKLNLMRENLKNEYYFNFKITDFCNLKCSHCYFSNKSFKNTKLMELSIIEDSLKKINDFAINKNLKKIIIIFTGGESLIANEDYLESLLNIFKKYISFKKTEVVFNSNLTINLSDKKIKILSEFPNITIQTSYDHGNKRFNKITYEKWEKNIIKIKNNKLPIMCNITVTKYEIGKEREIFNELLKFNFDGLETSLYKPFFNENDYKNSLSVPLEKTSEFFINFYKIVKNFNKNIYVTPIDAYIYRIKNNDVSFGGACEIYMSVSIDKEGNLFSCVGSWSDNILNEEIINIKDISSFEELFQTQSHLKLINKVSKPYFNMCFECEYVELCLFNCHLFKYKPELIQNECPGLSKVWKFSKELINCKKY